MAKTTKSQSSRSSYLLVELDALDEVLAPVKNSTRIKYTCIDVSPNYLVFGSTSGGIFVFQQETLAYLNTVANKEGPIVQVALAPDDNILGFATNRGHVVVLEHNVERSAAPQRLQVAYEHRGAHVTCLQWNGNASQLFIGDDKGRVSLINVSVSRARNIFQVPTASLPKLDSKICQLDFTQDCLLVSTLTRCYLWDTNKQQFIQIGKKLRDGEYGACFYPGPRIQDPSVIFAARPGSRIWEVDMKGNVVCTHQFKQALTVAPKKVISYRSDYNPLDHQEIGTSQSLAFTKLMIVGEREYFVFAWSEKGVYVFDLKRAEVVLWNDEIVGIKDVKCLRSNIFVSFADGTLSKYSVLPVEKCIIRFFQKGLPKHSALLAIGYQPYLLSSQYCANIIASFLADLGNQLSSVGEEKLARDVALLLVQLNAQDSAKSKLRSRPRDASRKNSKVRFHGCSISDGDSPGQSPPRCPRARSASPRWPKTHAANHQARCSKTSPLAKRRPSKLPSSSRLARAKQDSDDSDSWNPRSTSSKSDVPATSRDAQERAGGSTSAEKRDGSRVLRSTQENGACASVDAGLPSSSADASSADLAVASAYEWIDHVNGNVVLSPEKSLKQFSISSQAEDCGALADESSMATSIRSEELFGIDTDSLLTPGDFSDRSDKMCLSLQEEILAPQLQEDMDDKEKEPEPQPCCSTGPPAVKVTVVLGEETSSRSEDSDTDSNLYAMSKLYGGTTDTSQETYMNLAMYGGGIFLPPAVDFSVLQTSDVFPTSKEELSKLKESISTKIIAGKKVIFKNFKDFEMKIKQLGLEPSQELLDVMTPPNNNRKDAGKLNDLQGEEQHKLMETLHVYSPFVQFLWSALPKLDATEFIKATAEARSKLHDPSVGYDSEKIRLVLAEWVEQLHDIQKKVCVLLGHILRAAKVTTGSEAPDKIDSHPSTGDSMQVSDQVPVYNSREGATSGCISRASSLNNGEATRSKRPTGAWSERTDGTNDEVCSGQQEASMSDARRWNQWHVPESGDLLDLIFVCDPFCFSSEEHGSVSELARLSYSAKVWGDVWSVQNVLKDAADAEQRDADVPFSSVFSKNSENVPNGEVRRRRSEETGASFRSESREVDARGEDDDCLGSLFVKHYFHLLGASTIHATLASRSDCQFRTWNVFVNSANFFSHVVELKQKLAEQQLSVVVYLLKQRHWDANVLLFCLKEMYRISPKLALEMCIKRESRITPRDVLYVSKSTTGSAEFLMSFTDQILRSASEARWHEVFDNLFLCEEVRWEWIAQVLNERPTEKVKCDCGAPRPGAHLYPWKRGKFLEQALLLMDECAKLSQMCFDVGFWPGYLQLLKMQHDSETHLLTVLELGDADLLSDSNPLGSIPSSKDGWKNFLEWMCKQQQPPDIVVCLMCGRKHSTKTPFSEKEGGEQWSVTITWERVARVLLDYFGAKECLQLFCQVEIPCGSLTPDFFQACILSHMMEKQQSALAYRMLAQLNSYLWSHRPIALSPQVYYLFKKEKSRRESASSTEDLAQGTSSGISDDALQLRFLEEPSSHWGVRSSLEGACPLCGLPLASQLSGCAADGIVVFHCGHSFHKACMEEEMCLVCLCKTSVHWDKSASEESS